MIDRLSSRTEVVRLARWLHIAKPLKEAHFRLTAPADRVCRTNVHGVEAKFFTPTAGEWRKASQFNSGEAEVFLKTLLSEVSAGQVFYDVGSNVGEYAIFLAKKVEAEGRVIAFEPVRSSYERIRLNAGLNGLKNLGIYNVALADKPGKMNLELGGFLNRQSRLAERTVRSEGNSETVDVTTGDSFRQRESLPIPNAVKIDVEGYEYHVLQGMKETLAHPSCRLLCCEVHPLGLPAPVLPEHIVQAVKALGFTSIERTDRGSEMHLICRKEKSAHATA